MTLPIIPPLAPMEAATAHEPPTGGGWQYEPKWDGFRCVAFRDGDKVSLWSKSGRPLSRYFPEIVAAVRGVRALRFVIDGEIVVPRGRSLSFDALLQRIHPAEVRVRRLSKKTPARFVVFDLLVDEPGARVLDLPLAERRPRLEAFSKARLARDEAFQLSPATRDVEKAKRWLAEGAGSYDGIMAKRLDSPYRPGLRDAMVKVKRMRTADCVVGGFRRGKRGGVGSLLLGLYDDAGLLQHVGFTSAIPSDENASWLRRLSAIASPPGFTGRAPGGPSRWSSLRASDEWTPVKPDIVVEVRFDHWSESRFRHGTKLLRLRPDKAPSQCTLAQVATSAPVPESGHPNSRADVHARDAPPERRSRRSRMPGKSPGPQIKNKKTYEALKRKGMSKTRAAKISNAGKAGARRGGRRSHAKSR